MSKVGSSNLTYLPPILAESYHGPICGDVTKDRGVGRNGDDMVNTDCPSVCSTSKPKCDNKHPHEQHPTRVHDGKNSLSGAIPREHYQPQFADEIERNISDENGRLPSSLLDMDSGDRFRARSVDDDDISVAVDNMARSYDQLTDIPSVVTGENVIAEVEVESVVSRSMASPRELHPNGLMDWNYQSSKNNLKIEDIMTMGQEHQ